jgi:hypothetical protein
LSLGPGSRTSSGFPRHANSRACRLGFRRQQSIDSSSRREDLVPGAFEPIKDKVVPGLAKGCKIEGIGQVEWHVAAFDGTLRRLEAAACLVPSAKRRLLSPQAHVAEELAKVASREQTTSDDLVHAVVGYETEKPVIFSHHPSNDLPVTRFSALERSTRASTDLSPVSLTSKTRT